MTDFFQSGVLTTLHDLKLKTNDQLSKLNENNNIALIIPSLYSELEKPALKTIISELKKANYLSHIIIGIDCANKTEFNYALSFFSELPQQVTLLWLDDPNLEAMISALNKHGIDAMSRGKGRNIWFCIGYALALNDIDIIASHDADIVSYHVEMLSKLILPIAHPESSFDFVKGFYPRVSDQQFYGRNCRLFAIPLIQTLSNLFKDCKTLNTLSHFRYPLAGEFAANKNVIKALSLSANWGLEIHQLLALIENNINMAQVELADNYEHKHQPLLNRSTNEGLYKMAAEIAEVLFNYIDSQLECMTEQRITQIQYELKNHAFQLISAYHQDAMFNGVPYSKQNEQNTADFFSKAITEVGEKVMSKQQPSQILPSWEQLEELEPDFQGKLLEMVNAQNQFRGERSLVNER